MAKHASALREIRTRLGLSQAECATALGVAVETFRTWDAGRRPAPEAVVSAARTLKAKRPLHDRVPLQVLADELHVHVRTLRAAAHDGPVAYTASMRSTRIDAQGVVHRQRGSAVRLNVLVGVTDSTVADGAAQMALIVSGPLPDVFLMMARLVLWTNAATPLRLCAQCGTPFAALRSDSECCSPRCNKARWWLTPKGQKALDRPYEASGWRRGARKGRKA